MICLASVTVLIVVFSTNVFGQNEPTVHPNTIIELFYNCKCVFLSQCDDNGYIITVENKNNPRTPLTANVTKINCNSTFGSEMVCCQQRPDTMKAPNVPIGLPEIVPCGERKQKIIPRILTDNSDSPAIGDFPWISAIFERTSSGNYKFCCSGSLIYPRVILTANHRVKGKRPSDLIVVVNGKITRLLEDAKLNERNDVSQIVSHPNYNSRKLHNDAALLILKKAFDITEENDINTLCLPPANVSLQSITCEVAGWGQDQKGQNQEELRQVELPVVNKDRCQDLLRQAGMGKRFSLHDSFMCAGGEEGKDACIGDGGGPLMCPMDSNSERYFQAGIVSWGLGCGKRNVPGVYTDVQKLSEWIRNELADKLSKVEM